MLTMDKVLKFIKTQLGYPNVAIEKSDDEIKEYLDMFVLDEFSKYIPDTQYYTVDGTNVKNHVNGANNMFYIFEPDGCDILAISNIIFDVGRYYAHGYPYYPSYIRGDVLASNLMDIDMAESAYQFSPSYTTFEFKFPNIVKLYTGNVPDKFVVEYQRVQPSNLMFIPTEYHTEFLYLCLGSIMEILGPIRNKYTNISTPFGDIALNAEIGQAGREIKDRIITILKEKQFNKIIDIA